MAYNLDKKGGETDVNDEKLNLISAVINLLASILALAAVRKAKGKAPKPKQLRKRIR